jgi:hypothetical protein
MDSDLIKMTGLWLNDGKSGKYFSGKMNKKAIDDLAVLVANNPEKELRVLVFKNNKAKEERDPGYHLFVCVDKPRDAAPKPEIDDSQLPF